MAVSETSLDWGQWYAETLDGLIAAVGGATIAGGWATDPEGVPYIIPGQRRPTGIGYPHAMILSFRKRRRPDDSSRRNEHHTIESNVAVFDRGDSREYDSNQRKTLAQMGAVETALYSDRSLGGTCNLVTITGADAFEMETDRGDETVGDVQLEIMKTAEHPF